MRGDLPRGWAYTTLGAVSSDISYGFTASADIEADGPKFLRITDIQGGRVNWSDVPRCSEPNGSRFFLENYDIVIARTGATTGKSFLISGLAEPTVFASYLIKVRLADGVLPSYVSNFMNSGSYWEQIQQVSKGTAQPGANASILSALRLPLPPQQEQRRVVEKIDSLFARSTRARDELARIPKLIERYRQAVLEAAFQGDLTADWRSSFRPSPVSRPSTVVDEPWDVPDAWQWRHVRDVGEVALGRQRSPVNHQGPCMRPYVRAANITWQGWDLSDVKEMNFDETDFGRFHLEKGDVLVNEGSGSAKEVGKPAIWHGQIEGCCFQNTLIRVRPRDVSSEYLHAYFLYYALSGRFVEKTQGVNIFHIGKEGLAKLPIPVPSPEEQAKIVSLITVALSRLEGLQAELARASQLAQRLDQSILDKAFAGQLVPQDPADEPASKLLARIQAARADAPNKRRGRKAKPE